MDKFLKIAITAPGYVPNEARRIAALLATGFDFAHIRKPEWSLDQLEALIKDIPRELRARTVLHDGHTLARDLGVGAIHLNARNPWPIEGMPFSSSCHSVEEIDRYDGARYVFLSPIFDSISKPGYGAKFDLNRLEPLIRGRKVVALGGVTEEHIATLKEKGFYGAAMLGAVWNRT